MFYLAQACEDYTGAVIHHLTKLFNTKEEARAYASKLILDKCGFDYVEVTALEVEQDPLSDLTDEEYALATCPV